MIARDELAARVLVALVTNGDSDPVDLSVSLTDALLSALAVPPAAPAPSPTSYVPKVGDKIRHSDGRVVVLTAPRANCHFGSWDSFVLVGDKRLECVPVPTDSSWWTYLGPATASERAAAGLPVDRSVDEAKPTPAYPVDDKGRPLWVRVTGPEDADYVTVGKVYRVEGWDKTSPEIVNDRGMGWWLAGKGDTIEATWPSWEPCAAPAETPAAAQDAGLTEAERVDLACVIRKGRMGNLATAWRDIGDDARADWLRTADAAAAWFAKRGAK